MRIRYQIPARHVFVTLFTTCLSFLNRFFDSYLKVVPIDHVSNICIEWKKKLFVIDVHNRFKEVFTLILFYKEIYWKLIRKL